VANKPICVRIPEELKKDFVASCEANYEDMSDVLRRAIVAYVKEYYVDEGAELQRLMNSIKR
jgi:hypothetical protein